MEPWLHFLPNRFKLHEGFGKQCAFWVCDWWFPRSLLVKWEGGKMTHLGLQALNLLLHLEALVCSSPAGKGCVSEGCKVRKLPPWAVRWGAYWASPPLFMRPLLLPAAISLCGPTVPASALWYRDAGTPGDPGSHQSTSEDCPHLPSLSRWVSDLSFSAAWAEASALQVWDLEPWLLTLAGEQL